MHQSLLAAVNPGLYAAPDPGDFLLTEICGAMLLISVLVWFTILLVGGSNRDEGRPSPRWFRVGIWAATVIAPLALVVMLASAVVIGNVVSDATSDARAAYKTSVVTWLSSDYGITVSGSSARKLIDGEALVVDYDGADTMVEFITRADRDLAVRVTGGALLQPLTPVTATLSSHDPQPFGVTPCTPS